MDKENSKNIQSRIDQLEHRVEQLEEALAIKGESQKGSEKLSTTASKETSSTEQQERLWSAKNIQFGEEWLNRIGIGLLLIGVAFLFKYSIDQGWLIPQIRSVIGLAIGGVLLGGGFRMSEDSKRLKQILLGGGIAVFYITGFATFQLYNFMPSMVIWSFMVVVTLLALSLSLQQDEAVLSIVGTLGALGTPFMLYSGGGSVVSLMMYITLILVATATIYMKKGWQSLLWSIALGGFGVLVVAVADLNFEYETATPTEEWAVQSGVVIWLIVSWILPVFREIMTLNNPQRWPNPKMLLPDGSIDPGVNYKTSSSVHLMAFLVPLFMIALSHGVWEFTLNQGGIGFMLLAALGGAFYWPLRQNDLPKIASTHAFMGLVMLTLGLFLILEGNFLMIVLIAETVALRYIAYQTEDTKVSVSSHMLFGIVIFWMLHILNYADASEAVLMSMETVSQLLVIGAGGLLIPRWLSSKDHRQIYQVSSHIVFLIWLYQKFSFMENGQALVTLSWGIYAVILLILGFVRYGKAMRLVGMVTIFVVVGKLFLVDLSQLQAIWRILLFMGFGAVFLLLGYYGQSRWNTDEETSLSNH